MSSVEKNTFETVVIIIFTFLKFVHDLGNNSNFKPEIKLTPKLGSIFNLHRIFLKNIDPVSSTNYFLVY